MERNADINILKEIIKKTVDHLEHGKTQIFDIAEYARSEAERIIIKLEVIKKRVVEVIEEQEKIERLEKAARIRLMEVSQDITKYNEMDVRKAYMNASNLQAELKILQNNEQQLKEERTDLEILLRKNQSTLEKAEQLVSKVGVALNYLIENVEDFNTKIEEIETRGSLGSKVIYAQEEERRRVAREIHDGPAQSMANIVLRAEFCEKLMDKNIVLAKTEIKQLKELVRSSLKDVRKIIYDLRPMVLDDLGLIPAVSRYIEQFIAETKIKVKFVPSKIDTRFANTIEVAAFRVIQEALQNVKKHAKAKNIIVALGSDEKNLQIKIVDDGQGFNVQDILADKERKGYGILGMRERVEILEGIFEVKSQLQKGTEINIIIPLGSVNGVIL